MSQTGIGSQSVIGSQSTGIGSIFDYIDDDDDDDCLIAYD